MSTFGLDGLVSDPHMSVDISRLYPSRRQAVQLWQIYLNNVDPLLKLLHIPTIQPSIFAAINKPTSASTDLATLLFSIYFAAVTSLSPPETQVMLGQDRQSALKAYQRGMELCLSMTSFLDSPTINSLQAMSIYLVSSSPHFSHVSWRLTQHHKMARRHHTGGRSGWTLNGLLIRAAQLIGLHRDGEHFRLSPLDCEIRRRLWWQILGSDSRVAEDHGLSTGSFDGVFDTKFPLSIDDRDLSPDMEAVQIVKPRWTEMSMFLVATEMNEAIRRMYRLSAAVMKGNDEMTSLEKFLDTTRKQIYDRHLQYCDENIPIQKAALLLGRVQLGKLETIVRQQYLRGLNGEELAAAANEETLQIACGTIATGIELRTDELLSNFWWMFSAYAPYHVLTYTLWHLRVRPDVSCADRAWELVDKSFDLMDASVPGPGSKWNVLRKLRDKAMESRHSLSTDANSSVNLRATEITQMQIDDTGDSMSNLLLPDGLGWDLDSMYFPEWMPGSLDVGTSGNGRRII
jgi:hypothetical protein